MDRCDALIVGGGPAGSACAWGLRKAGLDVVVMDRAEFPRDKVCAGWITPAVIAGLELDVDDYRQRHVFQPITGFRIARMGGEVVSCHYDYPVSFAIRRCEFDNYLLQRSGARLRLGEPVEQIERTTDGWVINETLTAAVLVGAGGHFCPVARFLGANIGRGERTVMAQESEFEIPAALRDACKVVAGVPELFFCADLKGYGWIVRKGDMLNIGLGREDDHGLKGALNEFVDYLVEAGRIPAALEPHFRGHAYLCYPHSKRQLMDDGVLLVGDAAGLAYAESGEGIRPAIESGLLAAATLRAACRRYGREYLSPYVRHLRHRLGARGDRNVTAWLPTGIKTQIAGYALSRPWFVRKVLLDRWFLRLDEPPLSTS